MICLVYTKKPMEDTPIKQPKSTKESNFNVYVLHVIV